MKTTRELLELAARSIDCTLTFEAHDEGGLVPYLWGAAAGDELGEWSPDTDDGDNARLEAALGLDVTWDDAQGCVFAGYGSPCIERYSDHNNDKQAARRMATLRAAAIIGEMK